MQKSAVNTDTRASNTRKLSTEHIADLRCLIAHFRYIKFSASLRGWDAVKLNTKEISSYSLGPRIEVRILIYRKRPIVIHNRKMQEIARNLT
jgi:hypothetical protein